MFALFFFLMADIKEMRLITRPDVWIPLKMSNTTESVPRITGFANENEPHYALLYAELLRKYTSNPSLIGLASNTPVQQWFEGQGTSGYFCRHDNFISFVVGAKNLIANQKELQRILDLFKAKYEKTDWSLPASVITEAQKSALQTVFDANKEKTDLLKILCQAGGVETYQTACPILYGGKIFNAVPYVHAYTAFDTGGRTFQFKKLNFFINFQVMMPNEKSKMLYRPHAYLGSKITPEAFIQSDSNKIWHIDADILFADGNDQKIKNQQAHIHNSAPNAVASPDNMQIGSFSDLLARGPFVSRMTAPYDVTTLHILVDDYQEIPNSIEKLLAYLSKLPLDQQQFIIKQLFPFLRV